MFTKVPRDTARERFHHVRLSSWKVGIKLTILPLSSFLQSSSARDCKSKNELRPLGGLSRSSKDTRFRYMLVRAARSCCCTKNPDASNGCFVFRLYWTHHRSQSKFKETGVLHRMSSFFYVCIQVMAQSVVLQITVRMRLSVQKYALPNSKQRISGASIRS